MSNISRAYVRYLSRIHLSQSQYEKEKNIFIPTLWMSEVNVDQIITMENINYIVAPGSMKPD